MVELSDVVGRSAGRGQDHTVSAGVVFLALLADSSRGVSRQRALLNMPNTMTWEQGGAGDLGRHDPHRSWPRGQLASGPSGAPLRALPGPERVEHRHTLDRGVCSLQINGFVEHSHPWHGPRRSYADGAQVAPPSRIRPNDVPSGPHVKLVHDTSACPTATSGRNHSERPIAMINNDLPRVSRTSIVQGVLRLCAPLQPQPAISPGGLRRGDPTDNGASAP